MALRTGWSNTTSFTTNPAAAPEPEFDWPFQAISSQALGSEIGRVAIPQTNPVNAQVAALITGFELVITNVSEGGEQTSGPHARNGGAHTYIDLDELSPECQYEVKARGLYPEPNQGQ